MILDMSSGDRELLKAAYEWMESECNSQNEEVIVSSYSTLTDFYIDFDFHISLFYDVTNDDLYIRTYVYASGTVFYEKVRDPDKLINESDESRIITWMLLRTGYYLMERERVRKK